MYIHIIILIYDLNSKCLLQFKNMPYILSYFLLNPDFPILVFTLILLGSLVPFGLRDDGYLFGWKKSTNLSFNYLFMCTFSPWLEFISDCCNSGTVYFCYAKVCYKINLSQFKVRSAFSVQCFYLYRRYNLFSRVYVIAICVCYFIAPMHI